MSKGRKQTRRRVNRNPMAGMMKQTMDTTLGITALGVTAGMGALVITSLSKVQ